MGQNHRRRGLRFSPEGRFSCGVSLRKAHGGLADIYHYCGAKEAKGYMDRITGWAEKNIPRDKAYCDVTGAMTGEWYTLAENLYRVYIFTGDERYKRFARVWEYTRWWTEIHDGDLEGVYSRPGWHHAYSHVNTFASCAAAYAAGGGSRYLDTLKKAYDFVQKEQCFATGGFGAAENLPARPGVVSAAKTCHNTFETQCGSWAGFKLTKYLTGFTGEARYGDWSEKLLINGIGASLPTDGYGNTFYYSDYSAEGGLKALKPDMGGWPCCSGTRAEAVADYHDQLYYYDEDNVYISQFFASRAELELKAGKVAVEQSGGFPEEEKTTVTVDPEKPAVFGVCFRIPAWARKGVFAEVNGRKTEYEKKAGWGCIRRRWSPGDRLEILFPMDLWPCFLFDDEKNPYVVMYGPVALVCEGQDNNPFRLIDPRRLTEQFAKEEGMAWRLREHPGYVFRPFYALKEFDSYYMYIGDPAEYRMGAVFKGGWIRHEWGMLTGTPGIYAEKRFWGKGVRITAVRTADSGIADVYIDGRKAGEADLFAPVPYEKKAFEFFAPEKGKHTVRVVTGGRRNPASSGELCIIDRIEDIYN
ncbi:MAG: glycoside hydrolase family 127 protein [Abditibacteriota bacterium]|nr:glycoside hydrolase family 127 protein [Abditibacteriota bacterium]